jgi:hypothetical protein
VRASHYGGGDRPLPASFGEALGGEPGSRADVPAVSRLSPSAAVLDTARLGKATGRDPPGDRGQEELNRRDLLPSRVAGGGGGTATSPPTSTGRACGWCGQPTARPWERSWSWAASAWVQPVASTRTPPDATPRDCASSCSSGPSATPGQSRAATRHVPQRHQNRGRRRDADGGRLRPAGRRGHRGLHIPAGTGGAISACHQRPVRWQAPLPRGAVDPPAALQDPSMLFAVRLASGAEFPQVNAPWPSQGWLSPLRLPNGPDPHGLPRPSQHGGSEIIPLVHAGYAGQ